jgi:putative ABC transport system permease protein
LRARRIRAGKPKENRVRWTQWFADSAYDLRLAARLLAKDRAFSLVVIITLALGVGANAAMFSVIEAVLLQPLPFPEAERLVWITENSVTATGRLPMLVGPHLRDWKDRASSFDALSAPLTRDATMRGDERQVRVACVSSSLASIFGIAPVPGRDFLPGEFERAPGARWKRGFLRTIV